ncbi:MAG: hypothetical protein JSV43_05640 [Methanobacteriota archaeon]|nr:MAG: hypothetical protein JSV43_05640 [Euryarchaeota archaeon]
MPLAFWMDADPVDDGIRGSELEEIPEKERRLSKKTMVIVISLLLIFSGFGVWYFYLRPWSIVELSDKISGPPGEPGFEPYLAGKTVTIQGRVTEVGTNSTTLGPITFIELDNFNLVRLVEWNPPSCKVGDIITRSVRFEWSYYNEVRRVMSPDLDFPAIQTAMGISVVLESVGCIQGICLLPRDDQFSNATVIEVFLLSGDAFPLGLFNATLMKGVRGMKIEYIAAGGQYIGDANPEIDFIESIEDGIGEKGELRFVDANSNGLLDDEDYFEVNLERPSEENSIYTYMLMINRAENQGLNLLGGMAYIVTINRGTLRFLATPTSISYPFTSGLRMEQISETDTPLGITTEILISETWGPPLQIQDSNCYLWSDSDTICYVPLREGLVVSNGDFSINFTDVNNDDIVDSGDLFTITGLENHTNYRFAVTMYEGHISTIRWITGVGVQTALLPVIEWNDPVAVDYPLNLTFKMVIGRMYGVPGVLLGDLDERMVVDVKRDGLPILSSANLTRDFNITLPTVNISFEDADGNGFVNTGDFFICKASGPAEFEISLGYMKTRVHPIGDVPHPLIYWPISWQTD